MRWISAVCAGVLVVLLTVLPAVAQRRSGQTGPSPTNIKKGTSLPGTCTEVPALFQDTDSGGSELHVCTAANTWTKLLSETVAAATYLPLTLTSAQLFAAVTDARGVSTGKLTFITPYSQATRPDPAITACTPEEVIQISDAAEECSPFEVCNADGTAWLSRCFTPTSTTGIVTDATSIISMRPNVSELSTNTNLCQHLDINAHTGTDGITLTLPPLSDTSCGKLFAISLATGTGLLTVGPDPLTTDLLNDMNASVSVSGAKKSAIMAKNYGTHWQVMSTAVGTSGDYLPLAGGTMTGQIVADNLGIEFTEAGGVPTCAAGNYTIYADTGASTLKKCINGSLTDLDTTGGTPAFSTLTGGTNSTAAMVIDTGASLSTVNAGTIAATSVPVAGVTGLGTGVGTFLATPSSSNLASAVTGETGSGALVFGTSPAITTPTGIVKGDVGLGNVDNTSDATKNAATATLTNKRINPRVVTLTDQASISATELNSDNLDIAYLATMNQATTFPAPNGTPVAGQLLTIKILEDVSRVITWNTAFVGTTQLPIPTANTGHATIPDEWTFEWDAPSSKWVYLGGPNSNFPLSITGGGTGTASTLTGLVRGSASAMTAAELSGVVVTSGSNVTTPGKADVLQTSLYCQDAGANDTYACSLSPAITAYVTGTSYRFKANTANTGAASINFNSLGALTIKKMAGAITTDLADNDIRAGQWVVCTYDGTNCQMASQVGNAASTSFANPTATIGATAVNGSASTAMRSDGAPALATQHTLRVCTIVVGADNGPALVDADLGPQLHQCVIPYAATVTEITVFADAGTPNVIVHRRTGTTNTALLSSALATAASGALACAKTTAVAGYAGTTCAATLQNTAVGAGDTIGLTSGTAGGTAKRMTVAVTWSVN